LERWILKKLNYTHDELVKANVVNLDSNALTHDDAMRLWKMRSQGIHLDAACEIMFRFQNDDVDINDLVKISDAAAIEWLKKEIPEDEPSSTVVKERAGSSRG